MGKSKIERFRYKGDEELSLPKLIKIRPTIEGLTKAIKTRGDIQVNDVFEKAGNIEEKYSRYGGRPVLVEVWRGTYNSLDSNKVYLVEGCFDEGDSDDIRFYFSVERKR